MHGQNDLEKQVKVIYYENCTFLLPVEYCRAVYLAAQRGLLSKNVVYQTVQKHVSNNVQVEIFANHILKGVNDLEKKVKVTIFIIAYISCSTRERTIIVVSKGRFCGS